MEWEPFNAENVDPAKNVYSVAPAGKGYKLMVTKAEYKPTKSGDGAGLNLQIEIIEGPYMGKKIFSWLNLKNKSEQAQQIGQGELSALCRATGQMDLRDPSQLMSIPFYGDVGVDQDQKGDDRNFLKFGTLKSTKDGKVDRESKVNKGDLANKYEAPPAAQGESEFDKDKIPF